MKIIYTLSLTAFALTVILIVGHEDAKHAQAQADQYCKMVGLHKRDPDNGWPDFRGTYKEQCE